MHDAVARVRQEFPYACTPAADTELADDTVLIARTAEVATLLLKETESEAAEYGLHLNRDKVKRLAHGSDQEVTHGDGSPVGTEHAGAAMHSKAPTGHGDRTTGTGLALSVPGLGQGI